MDAASEEAYYKEQLQEFSQAKEAEARVIQMLTGYDMPVTAYNIMAANQMLHNRNGVFKTLFDNVDMEDEIDFEGAKAEILEDLENSEVEEDNDNTNNKDEETDKNEENEELTNLEKTVSIESDIDIEENMQENSEEEDE